LYPISYFGFSRLLSLVSGGFTALVNRPVALQLWAIGAILPLWLVVTTPQFFADFIHLWAAAKQLVAGDQLGIYNPITLAGRPGFNPIQSPIFAYPPHAGLILAPFGLVEFHFAAVAWTVLGLAFFYWAAKPYMQGLPPVLAILTPAAIICVKFGQTGLLIGGLWLLAFRGRWFAVALLTVKPHLGALSILSLSKRSVAMAALLVAWLVLLSVALFGPSMWLAFIDHSLNHGAEIDGFLRWKFGGVGPAMAYGTLGWLCCAVAGAILLARNVNVFTAATASFLISPYGFHYDLTVVSLGFGLLAYERWHELTATNRTAVALGFLSPGLALAGVWWIPPILLWGLWVQVNTAKQETRSEANRQTRLSWAASQPDA
jgi:alpha-1,2-mannosyltransferase